MSKFAMALLATAVAGFAHGEGLPESALDARAERPVAEAALEPDYAEVAADARRIADEIGERLIPENMEAAQHALADADAKEGHPRADQAYQDMEAMIKFCEAASGGGAQACRFKLEIKMGLGMGNTLAQLRQGMRPGSGAFGAGAGSGDGSNATPFGMYGGQQFQQRPQRSSQLGGEKTKSDGLLQDELDPFAGTVEELNMQEHSDLEFDAQGDQPVLESYRPLIDAYFRRLRTDEEK